jgi:hypothetical protein
MTEQKLKAEVHDGSIHSTVANTGATSSIGITKDKRRNAFISTGRQSTKAFHMPIGTVEVAMDMDELHHDVCHPAKDIHIVLGIEPNSLLSMAKFVDANYIAVFDKDKLNIYNANNTKLKVSRSTILCEWQCVDTNLWCIPLLPQVTNKTWRLSYATNHQQSSYCNALHRRTQSTTTTNSKHNPSLSTTTTQPLDSQPNLHGSRQSRTNNLQLGLASRPMQSSSTSRNWRKRTRNTERKCVAAYDQPRPCLHATTMTLKMTPNQLMLLAQLANRRQFSSESMTMKTRPDARCTLTKQENFQRNPAAAISTSWY